jgi:hypothetical protein
MHFELDCTLLLPFSSDDELKPAGEEGSVEESTLISPANVAAFLGGGPPIQYSNESVFVSFRIAGGE